ncbi:MAG TPA: ATP-binding protein, partial [Mycobacterium sp.]|nr:ATP-binding protein [Mycobacterium sp.]
MTNSITLPPDTSSVPEARRWVASQLEDAPEACDTALLLTSELVTNAVLHAATDLVVSVERGADVVRISVADHQDAQPELKHYEVDASTGRGLQLVAAMAVAWGVRPLPGGKAVWFELAVHRALIGGRKRAVDLDDWPDLDEWADLDAGAGQFASPASGSDLYN